jgi:carbon monoxide dehydrogenase subunit G
MCNGQPPVASRGQEGASLIARRAGYFNEPAVARSGRLELRLKHSLHIAAPLERVWPTMTDLESVARCLPGAEIAGVQRDGTHHGTFKLKLGPTTTTYRGGLRVQEADEATRTAVMLVSGPSRPGQQPVTATVISRASEHEDGTRVDVHTDLGGPTSLTQMGLVAVAQRASRPLLAEFAERLAMVANSQEGSLPAPGDVRPSRRPRRSSRRLVSAEAVRIAASPVVDRWPWWLNSETLMRSARTLRELAGRVGARSLGGRLAGTCPYCGARAGEACRTRSGQPARSPHASRPPMP